MQTEGEIKDIRNNDKYDEAGAEEELWRQVWNKGANQNVKQHENEDEWKE